mmetsp:Transcript_31615/g.53916  ORF Transcript_31615/g.53916 Transcript_31615/m.53916 type:complete len:262 (-) Transcript_31615:74-859(-)
MPPLHIHHNTPTLQTHPIRGPIRPLHILLVLVLHKRISPTLSRIRVRNQFQILHRTVRLHLPQQFPLGDFVRQPSDEQGIVTIHAVGILSLTRELFRPVRFDEGCQTRVVLGLFGLAFVILDAFGRGVDFPRWGLGAFEVMEEGGHAGESGAAFFGREGGGDGRDAGVGGWSSTGLVVGDAGILFFRLVVVIVRDVILRDGNISLELWQVFQWWIGHECRTNVGRHHHDGRSGTIPGHLTLGGHGSFLLLKTHGLILFIMW